MKYIFLIIFFLSPIFANTPVDIKKFSGLWYEIARIENSFQTSCVASSVEYKLQVDNTYDVYNRCFENELNGKLIEYNGFAKLENNQLFMRYFFVFRTSYKIEYLNDLKNKMDISKLVFTKLDPKGRYKWKSQF